MLIYFSILEGVYFLPFFQKNTLSTSKWQFLEKIVDFRGKIAFLRPLEWFFEKMAESGPPLFSNFKGGPLSSIFSINHSKCLKMAIYGLKADILKKLPF